jgi:hypothetical protein
MLAQQPYYPQSATPSHEFYSPQSVPMGTVPVHEAAPPIVAQNVPGTSPVNMPHAQQPHPQHHAHPQQHPQQQHQQHQQHQQQQQQQQQYLQMMQRYDTNPRANYIPEQYPHPSFQGHQLPPEQPMMVSYNPNYAYKTPGSRLLNQSEGTDWTFLGVGG